MTGYEFVPLDSSEPADNASDPDEDTDASIDAADPDADVEQAVAFLELQGTSHELLGGLNSRDVSALSMRYGLQGGPLTIEQVRHSIGSLARDPAGPISANRAQQLIARAERTLRHPRFANILRDFLGIHVTA